MDGISVVIPVCNESEIIEGNTEIIIKELEKITEQDFEIVFVENGSTDKTPQILGELELKDSRIKIFSILPKDLGLALKEGFINARYSKIIWYPIDLAFNLKFFPQSLDKLEEFDIILGSKNIMGSDQIRPGARKFLSSLYGILVRLIFKIDYQDTQSVKAFQKTALMELIPHTRTKGIIFEPELISLAVKNGKRICEIPVSVVDTRKTSKIDFKVILRTFLALGKFKMENILGKNGI